MTNKTDPYVERGELLEKTLWAAHLKGAKNHKGVPEKVGGWVSKGRSGVLGEKQKRRTRRAAAKYFCGRGLIKTTIQLYWQCG